ncbi:hypothetical protein DERP_012567 [Dermatophagoides pteronyssinus]|uniref:Uncharacterized protein n=1 Tax=Dermatophagoides pteronyssinus TaxID=6956 RepID=A0ABQ8IUV2_DERPT|nr:hypothetical protein DERP_012567 [Dermatophagoides pteronyssinus]
MNAKKEISIVIIFFESGKKLDFLVVLYSFVFQKRYQYHFNYISIKLKNFRLASNTFRKK